ncbi:hypothetical protein PFISCL1PPCAC_14767, partial [Pristionchus fissidentatus]
FPMSRLGDFNTAPRLKELVETLTGGGKLSHRFENFAIHNISKWILAGGYPKETMRIYGFPAENPLYVFMLDQNDLEAPHLQVRTPSEGHDCSILLEGLKEIVSVALPSIKMHGKILLESDTYVRDTFIKLQQEGFPFMIDMKCDCIPFYINETQRRTIKDLSISAPQGFVINEIDVPSEFNKIHFAWAYADTAPAENTRLRLSHLPSICIRDFDGNLAAWELTNTFGQLTHLYTFEPYRGKGIGVITEVLLAQKIVREDLHVYKYVTLENESVVRGTLKHPLWSQWKLTEDGKERGEEKDVMWSFNHFKYTKVENN